MEMCCYSCCFLGLLASGNYGCSISKNTWTEFLREKEVISGYHGHMVTKTRLRAVGITFIVTLYIISF